VTLPVVTDFMGQHCFEFRFRELCNERVEQNNFSEAAEAGEKRVRVARTFAAVHYVDTACRKTSAPRELK
jgi:hypothetical protein